MPFFGYRISDLTTAKVITMHKILVLNSGSTTLKFQLFQTDGTDFSVIAKGLAERIGDNASRLLYQLGSGEKQSRDLPLPDHKAAVRAMFEALLGTALTSVDELSAVGHRMGHGGEYFDKSVLIDAGVMEKIYDTMDLLPLHGAAFVHGVEAVSALFPQMKQIATFDSAFHQTMPKESYLYPIPLEQYEKHRIRRYGFHGTSHGYVAAEAAKMLGFAGKFITCHLGGGASVTAVKDGKSIDTSMGFTPMAGMMMNTRCGDIDPYIPLHIMKTQNLSADEVNAMLNKQSGLCGLTGGLSDLRDIEAGVLQGNQKVIDAVNTYVHCLIKYIGGYVAVLGGVDAIVFTAGAGENSSFIRKLVCERLAYLGIELDENANRTRGAAVEITKPGSKVRVLVIPTNEELVIARDSYKLAVGEAETSPLRAVS